MPKNKVQDLVYTIIMAAFMVYVMICYNISVATGGLDNWIFLEAFKEFAFMWIIAILLEFFLVGKIAHTVVFRVIDPKKQPGIIVTYAISIVIVTFMCPIMSFIATVFISKPDVSHFIVTWLQSMVISFPMAMCFQLFYAGPLVRFLFSLIFREKAK